MRFQYLEIRTSVWIGDLW